MIEIIFEDDYLIVVNKPPGLLIHRTKISEDKVFLLQQLRDQVGFHLYTIHRLDRGTSGLVIFGKKPEYAASVHQLFMDHQIDKEYIAVVRGWVPDEGVIDYPLSDKEMNQQVALDAVTHYRTISKSEIPSPIGLRYPTARFSLVSIQPEHGRRHQIRKHFAHLRHPVIGDRRHGDVKHNNYFRDIACISRMLLHAKQLNFRHPYTGAPISLFAPYDEAFKQAVTYCNLKN